MASFVLDPQLAADTHVVGRMALCRVLLMNDARYPWVILVPERPEMAEIIDLAEADQMVLLNEIAATSHALRALFNPDKLNVAALGNRVRQLHVHVQARFVSDEAWPGPVFGVGKAQSYPPHMAGVMVDRLSHALKPAGLKDVQQ